MAEHASGSEVAIIGMAGRFPGAPGIAEFWNLLRDGVDAGTDLGDDDLRQAGVPRELAERRDYVRRAYLLQDIECIDAPFFGLSPLEARLIDPQQRLFLECAYEALEDAGRAGTSERDRVGVFAGAGFGTYLLHNVLPARSTLNDLSDWQIGVANEKDCLAGRVSYKLNLRGPSVTVQTTCSTSLVAVHLACQNLLGHECDMALAGGASIRLPQRAGYTYRPEEMLSRDGRCRTFDRRATGTVFGSGVGVVLLKRLDDALRDRDAIHAVILGSAVNNDGGRKVGFTAPSEDAQAQVVATAQAVAGVHPSTIQYVEAHGTGTPAGDPIELRALGRAFRRTDGRGSCAIGSVKSNIGHLDTAAGIAGLIKAVLALKNKAIPATLHFDELNRDIDLSATPFYVNAGLREWPRGSEPRRAAVSSFGVGGTNAHAILEEAPWSAPVASIRTWHLLPVSARTDAALAQSLDRLRAHLERNPDVAIADVAFTLQNGRRSWDHRVAIVCRDAKDALAVLRGDAPSRRIAPGGAHRPGETPDDAALVARAERWVSGEQHDWTDSYGSELRSRVHLPAYPFERQKHWIEPSAPGAAEESDATPRKRDDVTSWFYVPTWHESPMAFSRRTPVAPGDVGAADKARRWLVLADRGGVARAFAERYRAAGAEVELVEREQLGDSSLRSWRGAIHGVAHFFGLDALTASAPSLASFDEAQAHGLHSLLRILQACGLGEPALERVLVVGDGLVSVAGESVRAEKSTVIALVRVLAQEHPDVLCRVVDVDRSARQDGNDLSARLAAEIDAPARDLVAAYRGRRRFLHRFDPFPVPSPSSEQEPFRDGGTYVITGGLGRVGFQIARHLLVQHRANVVVAGRTELRRDTTAGDEPVRVSDASSIRRLLGATVRELQAEHPDLRFEADARLRERLDALCAAYIADELGRASAVARERFSLAALAKQLGIARPHEKMFRFFVDTMKDEQLLEVASDGSATWSERARPEPSALRASLQADYPALAGYLDLLDRCARNYRRILSGDSSPLEVLFPRGDTQATARALDSAMRHSTAEAHRAVLTRLLVQGSRAPGVRLRILEIGAGNGLLTRQLAEAFRSAGASGIDYLVTDLGASFVKQAEALLPRSRYPFLRFGTFDITRSPEAQGLALGDFDVIIGLDVVHATPSLRASLRNLRSLLRPGGVLALLEAVHPARFLTMVWGTTREWWQFDDAPDRTESPLVTLDTWERIATEEGFEPQCVPHDGRARADYGLVLAFVPEAARAADMPRAALASPRARKTARLATLEALGGNVRYVAADVSQEIDAQRLIDDTVASFGPIDGIIHAAGDAGIDDVRPLARLSEEDCEKQLAPKAKGLLSIARALEGRPPRFVLAMSSNASVLGGPGLAAYAAANQFLDAATGSLPGPTTWISANWDGWPSVEARDAILESSMGEYAMSAEQSIEALRRAIASGAEQTVVSTGDLGARAAALHRQCRRARAAPATVPARSIDKRSPPDVESVLAALWGELLGSPPVGLDENFFDLGGDSIIGVRMVTLLRERFDIELPTASLFDAPTVRGFARLIVGSSADRESALAGSVDRGERRRRAREADAAKTRTHALEEEKR